MTRGEPLRPVMPNVSSGRWSVPTAQAETLVISSLALEGDGSAHIGYHRPKVDVRPDGVITTHTMYVPLGADYDAEIMVVLEAVRRLVLDVLDDADRMPPPLPPADDDEEDD